ETGFGWAGRPAECPRVTARRPSRSPPAWPPRTRCSARSSARAPPCSCRTTSGGSEGDGARASAFASGLAPEDTLLRALLRPGDHVIVPDDAYGGTYPLGARARRPAGAGVPAPAPR